MNAVATIARESPEQPDVVRLIEDLDAYQAALYPAESNHFLDLRALAAPDVRFFVARLGGEVVGCGAVRIDPEGQAEVKRMFVSPRARGMRLGQRILQRLEAQARDEGCRWLRLETGIHQPEALGLYRASGFVERGPFGDYRPDPLSVFMEKPLAAVGAGRVRRLEAHEVDLHRKIRLGALQESPDSFGDSFADIAARPRSYWEALTRSVTDPGRHAMFLACDRATVLGCAYGLLDADRDDGARVGGMWVQPAWRRLGTGGALLEAVAAWARGHGRPHLSLWAPAHQPAALALYRRGGFRETGRRKPLPTSAALEIAEMVRAGGDAPGPHGSEG
jgi:putative acetyltransferase